jgi:hypothetical protein
MLLQRFSRSGRVVRLLTIPLIAATIGLAPGCAAMFSGRTQRVRVVTHPEGQTVQYKGATISDGEVIVVTKRAGEPMFVLTGEGPPLQVPLNYDPDAWLIGDAVLLFVPPGLIFGLIGFGVDVLTGAWRDFEDPQHVYMRE